MGCLTTATVPRMRRSAWAAVVLVVAVAGCSSSSTTPAPRVSSPSPVRSAPTSTDGVLGVDLTSAHGPVTSVRAYDGGVWVAVGPSLVELDNNGTVVDSHT